MEVRVKEIEERLDAVEKRLFRYQISTLIMGLILTAGTLLGAVSPQAIQDVIQCKKLEIVDENNQPRVRLSMFDNVPGISIYDQNAKGRVNIMVDNDQGPYFILADEKGITRMQSKVNEKGSFISIVSKNNDASGIGLLDSQGKLRAEFSIDRNADPSIKFMDEKEVQRVWITLSPLGPLLIFSGTDGKPRIMMSGNDMVSLMVLKDREEKTIFSAP
jgi:hypothetical protein